ncbi:hypothetical protein GW17_00051022 [Ensete ventricosum]|nr:hypothetical protein GW17_00051022 [Ensete ventricosum]
MEYRDIRSPWVKSISRTSRFYRFLYFSRDPNLLHDDLICVGNRFFEGSACKGQPGMATANPLVGVATRSGSSTTGTNGCGQAARACCPRRDRKGQPLAARSQVVAARCKAARGNAHVRRRRQPARYGLKAAAPAHADGVQRRHLRRATVATAVQMGARRGLEHPFK